MTLFQSISAEMYKNGRYANEKDLAIFHSVLTVLVAQLVFKVIFIWRF